MDAVTRSEPTTDGGYREALAGFDRAVNGLKDSAELARLTDDPAAPGLQALVKVMESMAAQFRLRDRDRQAMAVALEQRVAAQAGLVTRQGAQAFMRKQRELRLDAALTDGADALDQDTQRQF